MTMTIRTEGSEGSFAWMIPKKMQESIEFMASKQPTADLQYEFKLGLQRYFGEVIKRFLHLLVAIESSPPDIARESMEMTVDSISMVAKIAEGKFNSRYGK
jgi:hypothetical protein